MASDPRAEYTEDHVTTQLYRWIARILAIGFWASIAVIALGVVLALARGDDLSDETLSFADIPSALAELDPDGLIDLGIVMLLLTPLSYVVAALVTFLRQRDRLFVGICLALILLIATSIGLATL